MMIMISASSFLTVYLGLELMSLCLYALVALNRDSPLSTEAAMKHFVLGALSSGLLLYGMSMVYGATGTLDITEVARVTAQLAAPPPTAPSWCSAWCSSSPASLSRSASRRSTCGFPTSTTARRRR
jgi:NADH:ubiquinone oxidoreductase subunit 2 (subunit N)